MKIVIVVNAYIKNKSQIMQAARIAEELRLLGAEVEILKNFNLADISEGKVSSLPYKYCIFLDKDKSAARILEKGGVRLFNSASSMEICDDKMLTHIALADSGIPMPDTVYAPLCYYSDVEPSNEFLLTVSAKLGFPLVAKKCYGSLGAGVFLVKNDAELKCFERENILSPHIYQKFIGCGGEDIRVIVVGGKYVCAMKRRNEKDFRSNVEQGGKGENFYADDKLISLCESAAQILKLDYCGVDVLTDDNGNRYVCEVNSNAFFAEAERVCGVNVAKTFAEHIVSLIKN